MFREVPKCPIWSWWNETQKGEIRRLVNGCVSSLNWTLCKMWNHLKSACSFWSSSIGFSIFCFPARTQLNFASSFGSTDCKPASVSNCSFDDSCHFCCLRREKVKVVFIFFTFPLLWYVETQRSSICFALGCLFSCANSYLSNLFIELVL